jgi:hypothetical protein
MAGNNGQQTRSSRQSSAEATEQRRPEEKEKMKSEFQEYAQVRQVLDSKHAV